MAFALNAASVAGALVFAWAVRWAREHGTPSKWANELRWNESCSIESCSQRRFSASLPESGVRRGER
jgi:hypothetical protein